MHRKIRQSVGTFVFTASLSVCTLIPAVTSLAQSREVFVIQPGVQTKRHQLAAELETTQQALRTVAAILVKLEAADRTEAVTRGFERGLLKP